MSAYYFFISSLPHVSLDAPPPMSPDEFLAACDSNLPAPVATQLRDVGTAPRAGACCPTEAKWNDYENCLRNEVARRRADTLERDANEFVKPEQGSYGGLDTQVQDALGRDPLETEVALDRMRWRFLDDCTVGREFALDTIFVYLVKLLLLDKRAAADVEAGRAVLEESVQDMLKNTDMPAAAQTADL